MKKSIFNFTIAELEAYFISLGEKSYRSVQVFEWIYRHQVAFFSDMSNQKKEFIELLENNFMIEILDVIKHQVSVDETQKFLLKLSDGNYIEAVLMKHNYGNSLCLTTQVGCNMGCAFCASGLQNKIRNLTAGEMVSQVMTITKFLNTKITHLVLMGSGEPFDNYDEVIKFLKIVNYAKGLAIGARHISVSTCGIVPKIYNYAQEKMQSNLAISLHASNDEVRNKIMKINKVYPIQEIIKAIKHYIEETNRRVTIEYILLKDINDQDKHAIELSELLRGLNVYINLIPYNEIAEKGYKRSTNEQLMHFYDILKKRGLNVTLRHEQGFDIDAACGQLRNAFKECK